MDRAGRKGRIKEGEEIVKRTLLGERWKIYGSGTDGEKKYEMIKEYNTMMGRWWMGP